MSPWVNFGPSETPPGTSAAGGEADENGGKAEVAAQMSATGVKPDVPARWPESPAVARSGPRAELGLPSICTPLVLEAVWPRVLFRMAFSPAGSQY